jgi:glutaredoxin 3
MALEPRQQSHYSERGMTVKVEIYTSPFCGYCARAKALLARKGVDFIEFDVLADSALRGEMTARAEGRTTVPQIFIDGRPVGGCDDLHALERAGELDRLLAGG